jgi:hypothetical protein
VRAGEKGKKGVLRTPSPPAVGAEGFTPDPTQKISPRKRQLNYVTEKIWLQRGFLRFFKGIDQ